VGETRIWHFAPFRLDVEDERLWRGTEAVRMVRQICRYFAGRNQATRVQGLYACEHYLVRGPFGNADRVTPGNIGKLSNTARSPSHTVVI
jgi:hypothetical protein